MIILNQLTANDIDKAFSSALERTAKDSNLQSKFAEHIAKATSHSSSLNDNQIQEITEIALVVSATQTRLVKEALKEILLNH
ncbi:hypothetical protein IV64_GL000781 [Lactiplantibacillus xiangfangensis]|uniref:Uncharacterized protein n=1 Tax=Lactiplantibacillus xiangfangensis TaxID=942150 RepID=A0A0R2M9K7_9LACO|nr:hypothetical protein IV64_GL000781 [Lactiplantibacillus xiangfangensis]